MHMNDDISAGSWAQGDVPARSGCRITPLVDGHATMLAMCRSFLSAKSYILLAGWDIYAGLKMVRGSDTIWSAADASQKQQLLSGLRDEGLAEDAIALWQSGELTVRDVLGYAVAHGVRVGVLLWDAYHLGSHLTNDPAKEAHLLAEVGVECLLDDSSRRVTHLTQSLHQKCAVIDGTLAYVGGIDLTVEETGDYDRWDTHHHPCFNPLRHSVRSPSAHPWHDVHCRIEGPVVADVQMNIVQRWMDVAARHNGPTWPADLPSSVGAVSEDGVKAQMVRTIPPETYSFAPEGIATILDAYLRAIRSAHRFIYIENQYLWSEVFRGLDSLAWGGKDPHMQEILRELANALMRGVRIAMVLPDHPNCGRAFTDGAVTWLRKQAEECGAEDSLYVFTAGSSETMGDDDTEIVYRPVYTHGKVMIVDDLWWTAGSANLNSRGMHSDAELNIVVADEKSARSLRLLLWEEHTHDARGIDDNMDDAISGLETLVRLARENRERVRRKVALNGHILPYMTEADGKRLGIAVHHEHGWLDGLDTGSGALPKEHQGRYL